MPMPEPKVRVRSPLQRRLQAANENPAQGADAPGDYAAALRAAIEPRPAVASGRAAQKAAAVQAIDLESELMHELQSSFDSIRRPFEPFQGEPAVRQGLEDPYAGYQDGLAAPADRFASDRFASDRFADDPFSEMNLRGGPPPPPATGDRFADDGYADDAFSAMDSRGGPPPPPASRDRYAYGAPSDDPFSGMNLRGGGPRPPTAPRLPQVGEWMPQAAELPAEPDLPVEDPLGIEDFDWQGAEEIGPMAVGRGASPRFEPAAPVDPRHYAAAFEHDVMRFGEVAEEEEDTGLFRPDNASDPDAPDQGYSMPLGREYQAQERRANRRSGRATLMMGAVVGVALAGGAVALALSRSDGATMGNSGPPRLITADASPTKVLPEAVALADSSKIFLDPVAANTGLALAPASEQVTALPQSPVEVAASDAISQIILPPGASPAPANALATAEPSGSSLAPRIVRTLVVRPDGTVLSSGTLPAAADSAAARLAAASAVPSATGLPARPVEVSPITTGSIPTTATAPAVPPAAAPQPAPVQVAAALPSTSGRIVVTPGQSGFVVSLVSHRTEAQAVAAYADLQSRYPTLLGNRDASIVPADLGERGVYYRVRVGPVAANQSEAQGFCNQLKAAGQDCFVVAN